MTEKYPGPAAVMCCPFCTERLAPPGEVFRKIALGEGSNPEELMLKVEDHFSINYLPMSFPDSEVLFAVMTCNRFAEQVLKEHPEGKKLDFSIFAPVSFLVAVSSERAFRGPMGLGSSREN